MGYIFFEIDSHRKLIIESKEEEEWAAIKDERTEKIFRLLSLYSYLNRTLLINNHRVVDRRKAEFDEQQAKRG